MEKLKHNTVAIKNSRFHTDVFSKIHLKCQGKRDGKKGLPPVSLNGDNMTPNIRKEHDRIYTYMAYAVGKINAYNTQYYRDLQALIADFTGKAEDITKLYQFLQGTPSELCLYIPKSSLSPDFEAFLSSKRTLEQGLDDMAIRQRRFEEYQQKLIKYKEKYSVLRKELDELYINIMVNFDAIQKNINLVKPMFWKASAEIDIRLSWYWQGVLLKHKEAKALPRTAAEPDGQKYQTYYIDMTKELKQQINDVSVQYQTIIQFAKI